MIRFSTLTGLYRSMLELYSIGWLVALATTPSADDIQRAEATNEEPPNGDFCFWFRLPGGRVILGLIDVCHHGWSTLPLGDRLRANLTDLAAQYSEEGAGRPLRDLNEFANRFRSLACSLDEAFPELANKYFCGLLIMLHPDGEMEVLNMATPGAWRRLPGADWQALPLAANLGMQRCETVTPGDGPADAPQPTEVADRFSIQAGAELFFASDGVFDNGLKGAADGRWRDPGIRNALNQLDASDDLDASVGQLLEQLQRDYPPGHPVAFPEDDATLVLIRRLPG